MSQLLTLTRAARLVGVARGALQKKIRNGELPTFEGMVAPDDLLRVYPAVHIENDAMLERMAKIKDEAYSHRVREHVLPDASVLAARLNALGKEHARTKARLERYGVVIEGLEQKLRELEHSNRGELQMAGAALRAWLENELRPAILDTPLHGLAADDSLLRIMTAHVRLLPSMHEFLVEGADSILDAGLRAGMALDYGCSDGSCGRCRARVVSGETKQMRAHSFAISADDQARGECLLCSHTAVTDVVIEAHEAQAVTDIPTQHIAAWVKAIKRPVEDVLLLRLQTVRSNRLRFLAGQSVTLAIGDDLTGEYHAASCPCDADNLQFHIRRTPGDPLSEYLFNGLHYGDTINAIGPRGDFVLKPDSPNPIIFVAWDTGFAPIKSLIEHALAMEVAEAMHLYWIATTENGHYMHNLCRSWTDALDNISYTPLMAGGGLEVECQAYVTNELLPRMLDEHSDLTGFDIYVAGPQRFTATATKLLGAHGVPPERLAVGVV